MEVGIEPILKSVPPLMHNWFDIAKSKVMDLVTFHKLRFFKLFIDDQYEILLHFHRSLALKSIANFMKTVLGKQYGTLGKVIVMVIRTFGDYGRWNPHRHALVAAIFMSFLRQMSIRYETWGRRGMH